MKINNFSPPGLTGQSGLSPRSEAKTATAEPSAVSHINPLWQGEQQDIDSTKVEALRQAIAEGKLEFRAEAVADRLLESLAELQGSLD